MEEKQIMTRVPKETWSEMRQIAFNNEMSLNQLCKEAFELIIKKYNKNGKKS